MAEKSFAYAGARVMARVEKIGLATLYLGDCREIAQGLERPAAVITDPPYGLGDKMQGGTWGATATRADMLRWDQAPPSADDMAWMRALTDRVVLWGGSILRFRRTVAGLFGGRSMPFQPWQILKWLGPIWTGPPSAGTEMLGALNTVTRPKNRCR